MRPTVREYRPSDFERLHRIDQVCFTRGISYSRAELAAYIRRPGALTLVGEVNSVVVGFIVARRERRGFGHIITLDVMPQARRAGLGSRLLSSAEERLRQAGCTGLLLETAVDNTAGLAFYERHGYAVLKTIPRYYQNSVDALVMGKQLGSAGSSSSR